jgi:hypothetical protein
MSALIGFAVGGFLVLGVVIGTEWLVSRGSRKRLAAREAEANARFGEAMRENRRIFEEQMAHAQAAVARYEALKKEKERAKWN